MKRIMLDIESFSLAPNAYIRSVGAVVFDVHAGITGHFYRAISAEGQAGRDISPSTVSWWLNQAVENPAAANFGMEHSSKAALQDLSDFIGVSADLEVWANGPQFDCVALGSLYQELGLTAPWRYNQVRDCRTLWALAKPLGDLEASIDATGYIAHNAFDDAHFQALKTINALRALNLE